MKLDLRKSGNHPKASHAQVRYLDILFSDCGFSREQKKAKLQEDFEVNYCDELTINEASQLIGELKQYKEEN